MGKEEDKIEKLIRGLLKLPQNRRCINCNSLGPQYACTTFWTFVCTNCSGVHREFTHRVKSISMAKFSMEEVNSLQAGGNEKAREIYFKTWNPLRNFFPDNSNIQKLRDFIKQVYVDRRYTDENHVVLPPRIRNSDKDESYERTRQDTSREKAIDRHNRYVIDEVRSPGYPRDINNERYNRNSNNEVRSPGYSRENSKYGGLRASSSRFDGTDGRYQVDDARIAGRSATQMFTTEDIKPIKKSPPPVRNVREFLGEKFVSLRVGDQTKRSVHGAKNDQARDNSARSSPIETCDQSKTAHKRSVSANVHNTISTATKSSINNESLKHKSGSEGSLVDFSSFPPPPPPPPPPNVSIQNQDQQIQVIGPRDKDKFSNVLPPPKNTLEFLLFELSSPAEIPPSDQSGAQTCEDVALTMPSDSSQTNDSSTLQLALVSTQEFSNTPTVSTSIPLSNQMVPDFLSECGFCSFVETNKNHFSSNQEQEPSCRTVLDNTSAAEHSNHQADNDIFPELSAKVDLANSTGQSAIQIPVAGPTQEKKATIGSSGRAELPEDLFASLYQSRAMPPPTWQMSPSYDMGFTMQYYQNAPMKTPPYSNVRKSVNPFDTNDDVAQHHLTTTSSVPIVQGGLTPTCILRTQSYESHFQGLRSAPSPSFESGGYIGQFHSNNIPPSRLHEIGGFDGRATTDPIHSNQYPTYQYPAPADLKSFPMGGGNPFG